MDQIQTFTLQRFADAALMQVNIEFRGDAVTQIGTAPAHHAITLAVGTVFHPLRHFAPLGFGQTQPARRAGPIREPGQAIRVGTNTLRQPFQPAAPAGTFGWLRPVARRLPVPAGAAPSRACPSSPTAIARMRRAGLASAVRAAAARNCEIRRSWRAISMADMLPPPRINGMLHRVTFAANWESSQESGSRAVGMSRGFGPAAMRLHSKAMPSALENPVAQGLTVHAAELAGFAPLISFKRQGASANMRRVAPASLLCVAASRSSAGV
jgi:hypothetical protein